MSNAPSGSTEEVHGSATEPLRAGYDRAETPPSAAVVHAVAVATNTDPVDLPSLYRRIDPDVLDALVGRTRGGSDADTLEFAFSYADHRVTIDGGGSVTVTPPRGGG